MKKIFSKQNRVLLSELVRTDFKLRYQGSVLGYTWSLLRPLLLFTILYIVFAKFLKIGSDIQNYPIYLLLGIVLWSFFSDMTSQSLSSIVARGDLIRKIRIPRWLIIVSTSMSALINLGLNLVVVLIFALFTKLDLMATSVFLPFILLEIYIFALGVSLILSAMFVKYRDISHIWEVFLQAGFYLTPILYPISLITNITAREFLLLNPLAQSMQDARQFFVTKQSITLGETFNGDVVYLIPISIVIFTLIIGLLYFRSQAKTFAENI